MNYANFVMMSISVNLQAAGVVGHGSLIDGHYVNMCIMYAIAVLT
jgi:hypothetical protein